MMICISHIKYSLKVLKSCLKLSNEMASLRERATIIIKAVSHGLFTYIFGIGLFTLFSMYQLYPHILYTIIPCLPIISSLSGDPNLYVIISTYIIPHHTIYIYQLYHHTGIIRLIMQICIEGSPPPLRIPKLSLPWCAAAEINIQRSWTQHIQRIINQTSLNCIPTLSIISALYLKLHLSRML